MRKLLPPPQPDESAWAFVDELKAPESPIFTWTRQEPREDEVDLRGGVKLVWSLRDEEKVLETARADLLESLRIAGVSSNGDYALRFRVDRALGKETFRIAVKQRECELVAGDLEGIRRAIYCFEEFLKRADGPFLKRGITRRRPVIYTRISRCFFGPIKRPPLNRDELADDENYYPDGYLSRLAREGVNGLWLTVSFHELCRSRFFPEFGKDADRRLAKLREIVARCARYGIGVYVFCIEPRGFGDIPEFLHSKKYLKKFPELAGHEHGGFTFFCTSTQTGLEYLEEATRFLFVNVPKLAGLIDINMGERPTHCYSNLLYDLEPNTCPRCSKRTPGEVFRDTLLAIRKGMRKGNPESKLISWLYVPGVREQPHRTFQHFQKEIARIVDDFPPDVIFQYNFESMGRLRQLGQERVVQDYSLAYVGPSGIFSACARRASAKKTAMAAKLQVGCSHEVASVPWVPAPGNLFRKYKEMHRLGVSTVMQCWYFGSYPSLMTRAAGRLSFAPLPKTEEEFLYELAAPEWGSDAPLVAEAWAHFGAGYREFPASLYFAWFGPVHDSTTWPLHLEPQDRGIAPSWCFGFPPSGDRIGECVGHSHTLEEVLLLCERMVRHWRQGNALLRKVSAERRCHPRLSLEIGVAEAMGIQLESAFNVLRFYAIRERLFAFDPAKTKQRMTHLKMLKRLVRMEIRNSRDLALLASRDSRLGFHSEAEGYRYFPALLHWRVGELQRLDGGFRRLERKIMAEEALFPTYTGVRKTGKQYRFPVIADGEADHSFGMGGVAKWEKCRSGEGGSDGWSTMWRAAQVGNTLIFEVVCHVPEAIMVKRTPTEVFAGDHVSILIEHRRLWPVKEFVVGISGHHSPAGFLPGDPLWKADVEVLPSKWELRVQIPVALFRGAGESFRINVIRRTPEAETQAWVPLHPLPRRLLFGDRNPRDLGWLTPEKRL